MGGRMCVGLIAFLAYSLQRIARSRSGIHDVCTMPADKHRRRGTTRRTQLWIVDSLERAIERSFCLARILATRCPAMEFGHMVTTTARTTAAWIEISAYSGALS